MKNKNELSGLYFIFCGRDCDLYKAVHSGDTKEKMRLIAVLSSELRTKTKTSNLKCEDCMTSEKGECFVYFFDQVCQIEKNKDLKLHLDRPNNPRKKCKIPFSQSKKNPTNQSKIDEIGFKNWIDIKLYHMIK